MGVILYNKQVLGWPSKHGDTSGVPTSRGKKFCTWIQSCRWYYRLNITSIKWWKIPLKKKWTWKWNSYRFWALMVTSLRFLDCNWKAHDLSTTFKSFNWLLRNPPPPCEPRKRPGVPYFPWNPCCLIEILIMVYDKPHVTGQYSPLYTLNNQGPFFHLSCQQGNFRVQKVSMTQRADENSWKITKGEISCFW